MDEREAFGERSHPSSGATLVGAVIALLVLTALSFGFHYADLGRWGTVIALSIAAIKVTIVGLVFMELLESLAATRMIAIVVVMWVALLCLGIYLDVAYR